MHKSALMIRSISLLLAGVFLFSFLTVEVYESSGHPWLKYPGFLEAHAEIAVTDSHALVMDVDRAARSCAAPYRAPFLNDTTLFLHIYRGPPLTDSEQT
jgi:hypothetical protein